MDAHCNTMQYTATILNICDLKQQQNIIITYLFLHTYLKLNFLFSLFIWYNKCRAAKSIERRRRFYLYISNIIITIPFNILCTNKLHRINNIELYKQINLFIIRIYCFQS